LFYLKTALQIALSITIRSYYYLGGPLLIKLATQAAQALKTLRSGSAREARTSARHGE